MKITFQDGLRVQQWTGMLGMLCLLAGLLSSRALLSIGMFVLAGNVLIHPRAFPLVWKRFLSWKPLPVLTVLFLAYAVSGFWSSDVPEWLGRMRVKLPFLVLPLAIAAIPVFRKKEWYTFLYIFLLYLLLASLWTWGQLFFDMESLTKAYSRGQIIPTPIHHIRFSLLVVLAIAAAYYLQEKRYYLFGPWERWLQLACLVVLSVFLHVLAVRSGLLALYLLAVFTCLRLAFRGRRWWRGFLWLGLLALLVVLAFRYIPTLNNRLYYTLWNLEQINKEEWLKDANDPKRIVSMQAGLNMGLTHPWTGVGVGDIKGEADRYYRAHYPPLADTDLLPHNQYLFVLAGLGFPGLLLFLLIVGYPLLFRRSWQDYFFAAFHLVILSSFLVEMTLETQLGTAIYLVFLLPGMRYFIRQAEGGRESAEAGEGQGRPRGWR